ncbi:hypothetical protein C922_05143 [Plasmodium inui San Antonio 1]|uniref:Uncharacterized protein n=1 Tax=Plasmodium inui San Antonio 1 TaxID=1237626 RepID=W6ZYW2_9APIC|nr:hypothetical protein C922_05143 [Plasmodium inui San Antonio 1]EUD64480.1 hypothetical protein C922_05143 [Plasmodium inui San Antonio 1]
MTQYKTNTAERHIQTGTGKQHDRNAAKGRYLDKDRELAEENLLGGMIRGKRIFIDESKQENNKSHHEKKKKSAMTRTRSIKKLQEGEDIIMRKSRRRNRHKGAEDKVIFIRMHEEVVFS